MHKREFLKACASLAGLPLTTAAGGVFAADTAASDAMAGLLGLMPSALSAMAANPQYDVQIVYTPIRRNASRTEMPQTYAWQAAPGRWYSAGSLAKLPIALLAAEFLSEYDLGFDTRIELDGESISGEWPAGEPAAETFQRSLNRLFAASENAPFNRLYDFLGPDAMNARLAQMGYGNSRLIARMGGASGDNRATRGGSLLRRDGVTLMRWPRRYAAPPRYPFGRALAGRAWRQDDGTVIPGPHDFSLSNFLPLTDLHQMLLALVLPDLVEPRQRWAVAKPSRNFLRDAMQMAPRQSTDPVYAESQYPDSYASYFVIGGRAQRRPDSLTLLGKGSLSYGYMSDVRYLRDTAQGGEALLSAVIYANADGVLNDGQYDYENVALPFMVALGQAALAHSSSLG